MLFRYCLDVIPRTLDEFVNWFCEDCKLAALPPKHDPSRLHKEDPVIKIAHVKTPKRKKKQKKGQSKKRKTVPLLAEVKDKVCYPEEAEATGPDHDCVLGPNQIKNNVVLGLEKIVFHKLSSESTRLDNCPLRKHESLQSQNENLTYPEQVTKPNGEDASQIIPCVDKGVSQKQSSESNNQASAIPENEPLQSRKKDATTNSAQLETINRTKKQNKKQKKKPKKKEIKKKKTVSLVAGKDEEATKPNHECISPTNFSHKVNSDSGPNQITPCVLEKDVFQKQHSSESAELDNCCPENESVKRTSDATSVDVRRKKRKTGNSIAEHSSCESSCTDVPLKRSVEEQEQKQDDQRCELNQSNIVDLVSDSSSIEKELNNETTEIETENRMHQEQGAYASQSAYLENNVQSIRYQPARPIIDPLWR